MTNGDLDNPDPDDWTAAYTAPTDQPDPAPATAVPAAEESGEAPASASPAPMFSSLEAWVTRYFAPTITAELGQGMRWCPQWWRHAEAVSRLEALWRAWEHLRAAQDPTAMSVWWRDHADYHLGVLMEGSRSPFRQCSGEPARGHRDDLQPLPVDPPPPGWFGDSDEGEG